MLSPPRSRACALGIAGPRQRVVGAHQYFTLIPCPFSPCAAGAAILPDGRGCRPSEPVSPLFSWMHCSSRLGPCRGAAEGVPETATRLRRKFQFLEGLFLSGAEYVWT